MPLSISLGAVRKSRFVLPLVLAMAVTFLVVNEAGYQRALASSSTNDEVLASREEVHRLRLLVLDAESGQRGYLLTGRPDFREPLDRANTAVQSQLATIRKLYADQPSRAEQLKQIEELTLRKMSEMQTTVTLYDSGKVEAAQNLVSVGLGLEFMRSLDQVLGSMAQQDQIRLQVNRNSLRDTLRLNRIGIAALVGLSLMWLALYLRQARLHDEERALKSRELRAQHDELESEVGVRTRDLTEIATHLQTVREDERSRLARELHDELGGLLTAAKLDLARVKSRLREAGPEVAERISHLSSTLDAGIALKRRIIEDLRPSTLSNLGLKATLEVLCREFARRSEVEVQVQVEELPLSDAVQLSAYRLVQESLTNVAKYARAATVQVDMRRDGDDALLTVVDDGVGFDMARVSLAARGLAGMRFRVQSGGGLLNIQAAPGEGTAITARLPLVLQSGAAPADGPSETPSLQ